MIERYYEQSVMRDPENSNPKKIFWAKVIRWVSIIVLILMIFYYYLLFPWNMFLPGDSLYKLDLAVKIIIIIGSILPTGLAVGMYFLALFLKRKYTEEFDYRLRGDVLRIVRITNRSKRKLYVDIPISCFDRIGKATSKSCKQAEAMIGRNKKKCFFAAVNLKNEDDIYYALLNFNGKSILYFEPDDGLLRELRMALGREILEKENAKNPVF